MPQLETAKHNDSRLFFLDWVRILAFFLLIFYHVGMYYVTWGHHVKSVDASHTIEPLMQMSSPWRLGLLFMISGVASRFMLDKISLGRFLGQRSVRLLLPLVFGMLVIVPPQTYCEVIEKFAYQGSYGDFLKLYLSNYRGFRTGDLHLIMPTWNHLWFVSYLWVYTLVLGAVVLALGPRLKALSQRLANSLTGWKIIVLPLLVLGAARLLLASRFPETHALFGDWFNHANYFTLFLIGALLANQPAFWSRLDEQRWSSLGLALFCWAFVVVFDAWPDALVPPGQLRTWSNIYYVVVSLCEWSAIVAVCGFAHRHLQSDSPARRYLTVAVFPVYIVHQTLIVVFAHALKPAHLSPLLEGGILVVLTLTCSFGVVEIVRRVAILQPLFGVHGAKRAARPVGAAPVTVPQSLAA